MCGLLEPGYSSSIATRGITVITQHVAEWAGRSVQGFGWGRDWGHVSAQADVAPHEGPQQGRGGELVLTGTAAPRGTVSFELGGCWYAAAVDACGAWAASIGPAALRSLRPGRHRLRIRCMDPAGATEFREREIMVPGRRPECPRGDGAAAMRGRS